MASNSFGNLFRITTWGESHGKAIGVVIDGCPAGLLLSERDIQEELFRRRPGLLPHTSPRPETDEVEIFSGVFEGVTTGAPISLFIRNQATNPQAYEAIKDLLRPGHATFTYLEKYGIFDHRGGGRSSARETACRVAAGAIAKKILRLQGIEIVAYVKEIGGISCSNPVIDDFTSFQTRVRQSPLFCHDPEAERPILEKLAKESTDSFGGIVECQTSSLFPGLGDPVYEKLEASLAKGMLSLPASKGIEFGAGFAAARMKGSEHNDLFFMEEGKVKTRSNHAGGTLGGISTGMPLLFRVAFKPPSSIPQPQKTLNLEGEEKDLSLPPGSRHDPCVTVRAVPVVEAMTALALVDAFLLNRTSRLEV